LIYGSDIVLTSSTILFELSYPSIIMKVTTARKKNKAGLAMLTTLAALVISTGSIAAFGFLMPSAIYASGIGEGFDVCLVFTTYPPIQTDGCSSNPLVDLPISV
jgi:hypothetical protein